MEILVFRVDILPYGTVSFNVDTCKESFISDLTELLKMRFFIWKFTEVNICSLRTDLIVGVTKDNKFNLFVDGLLISLQPENDEKMMKDSNWKLLNLFVICVLNFIRENCTKIYLFIAKYSAAVVSCDEAVYCH